MSDIKLSDERRDALVRAIQASFSADLDEDISTFKAEQILDLMVSAIGPAIYNQAVQDVRAHLQIKLDDLDGEVYVTPS
jgi:uncharacterized protein (DUF2164 family)